MQLQSAQEAKAPSPTWSTWALVDLGEGIEGLIHVSEMPGRDETRGSMEPGSPITVRVLKIDHERRRIGLSLREDANSV